MEIRSLLPPPWPLHATLIGIGGLTRDPYGSDPRIGRVRHFYVLPQRRGRGIGSSLLSAIERYALTHFDTLVLRTDTTAAAKFYETLGYEHLVDSATATHRRTIKPKETIR